MSRILAINGSYRDDGITDQAVEVLAQSLRSLGAEVDVVLLRDHPIEFCRNCRECTQEPGEVPGRCVQQDGMGILIDKIERADGYILASPTNFYSVTALFKRFMERLTVYAYWPWERNSPQLRKKGAPRKKAVLISSCAAPGVMGRFLYGTHRQLKMTAQTIGARSVGVCFIGLIAKQPDPALPEGAQKTIRALARRLV